MLNHHEYLCAAGPEVLREVRLYGVLGKRFGRVHRLAVASASEAVRALCAVLDGFERWLFDNSEPGYHVFAGRVNLGADDLELPTGTKEVIRIVPAVTGAKRQGVLQTVAGAVLVVAGVMLSEFPMVGAAMVKMGVMMMIGGVIQMLSPQHKTSAGDKDKAAQSYGFNGPVNMDAEGGCVPLLYGRMLVGSVVISGGIMTSDLAV